jgi:small subunit ribosomal protein S4
MTRKESKFKKQRRLGVLLPGLGDKKAKGALSKRPYPPGQHGPENRRRSSEYGVRLKEKQKLRYHYGLKEKQLKTMILKAKRKESNWMNAFTSCVERRLDNLLFRAGFFPTIPAARQAVVHGHVLVDGKKCDIPSAVIVLGSEISLKKKMSDNVLVVQTKKEPTLELPHFIKVELNKDKIEVITVIDMPLIQDIPFEFEPQYVIEYYGKLK